MNWESGKGERIVRRQGCRGWKTVTWQVGKCGEGG